MPIIPDVIVAWPRNCDYPLWREFIEQNQTKFDKVIVAFTGTPTKGDHDGFVRQFFKWTTYIDVFAGLPGDWRDNAVKAALKVSTSDWVWFTEQDFLPEHEFFEDWERAEKADADVFAAYQGARMHPCSILVKRSVLNEIKLDFGIIPGIADHFARIQEQLENGKYLVFHANPKTYKHYNGLSSNWYLLTHGQMPNYEPEVFKQYLIDCYNCQVPKSDDFEKSVLDGIQRLELFIADNA